MANPFRDMSVIMQALVAAAVAVVLVLVGVYVPGSPIARERDEVDSAVQKRTKLNQEVTQLQVYKQRYGELKQQMDALSKQLDTLKTIVPANHHCALPNILRSGYAEGHEVPDGAANHGFWSCHGNVLLHKPRRYGCGS